MPDCSMSLRQNKNDRQDSDNNHLTEFRQKLINMNKKTAITMAAAFGLSLGAAAQSPASFPGGQGAMEEYISTNMVYPSAAKNNGIEGIITVDFTVKPDGTIGAIKLQRMVDPDLEQEAIRLVKSMPIWTPATDAAGTPISSTVTLPITFSLGD